MITTLPTSTAPQEGPHGPVYYLDGDTDHDTHDTMCCCAEPHPLPHRAIGASLYKLDLEGARAWHALRVGSDVDSFTEWCNSQESQGTSYGIDSEAAIDAALQQARKDGWFLINYPEPAQKPSFPDNYQDSRANYQDIPLYRRYRREPENRPLLTQDEAPFPLWIVPPGYRMARLSDMAQTAGYTAPPCDAGALLLLSGVTYAVTVDLWGWKDALVTWEVEKTGDTLVFWRKGRVPQ